MLPVVSERSTTVAKRWFCLRHGLRSKSIAEGDMSAVDFTVAAVKELGCEAEAVADNWVLCIQTTEMV